MGKWIHKLKNIDPINKVADCSNCGKKIRIYLHIKRWRCCIGLNAMSHKIRGVISKKPTNCDICGKETIKLENDHDHNTHFHRGWVCRLCNKLLYSGKDDINVFVNAVKYLKRAERWRKKYH